MEYRVWCHPPAGAPDIEDGNDYYYAFENCEEALTFSEQNRGTEKPLALILQEEYIDEPEPGNYMHVRETRHYDDCGPRDGLDSNYLLVYSVLKLFTGFSIAALMD